MPQQQSHPSPLDLALKYMDTFYSGRIEDLSHLLARDCIFKGPFFEFDNAEAYIDSLMKAPPRGLEYKIIDAFENETSACLVYRFFKPGLSVPMSQLFETRDGKIYRILLIFDTVPFTE